MKKILGLDLGTNSIGWALIEKDDSGNTGKIVGAGSRIIPMSQDVLGKFDSGQSISQTAERTSYRGIRRLRERHLLRRERLHRVLHLLNFLPEHYATQIDFNERLGQYLPQSEPKIAYKFNTETKQNEFLFLQSFQEMLRDFAAQQPQLVADGKKVPYDWTIYYLRKKALTQRIEKEELAWLLLHFNQKRGYYQLRGEEEEEQENKLVEFYSLPVTSVEATDDKKGDETWYNVHLQNGWIYRRTSKTFLDWQGKTKDFIVTTELTEDRTPKKDKEGKVRRSFRAPAEDDWTLVKKKTESDIDHSGKTVGAYIYDTLLQKPSQKINGKLVRVVERKFYKNELLQILGAQTQFHKELENEVLYKACLEELYPYNDAHRTSIGGKDFTHLFVNDIIFYQRPLKSKKSLISNCKFESRTFVKDGVLNTEPLKAIAKSHPLFQEFRLWQFIQNLKIYQREKRVDGSPQTDVDVTDEFLVTEADYIRLFEWLNLRKEVDQKAFLKGFLKIKKADDFRWNYVEEKQYPANETRAQILSKLSKVTNVPAGFLTTEKEEALWHILYSVEDKHDIQKALKTFGEKNGLGADFADVFRKFPPFEKDYGSLSAKAIKKLLPLMRIGSYWKGEHIIQNVDAYQKNIGTILNNLEQKDQNLNEDDRAKGRSINRRFLSKLEALNDDVSAYKGLELFLASYVVYGRHSEDGEAKQWKTANDIELLQQHSLRNPIVEQVINETLQVVRDIWKHYCNGAEGFFSEIHIELGREMKNPAGVREEMTRRMNENEATNLRMKALLQELLNGGDVENVRPYSPMQQEILRLYEEGALMAAEEVPEYIAKISKQAQPTQAELVRYKLWMEQKYRSPYTGEVIPLSKLFTRAYDIEHIIPQSRYFDDSFSNKVICEVEVNRDKANATAYEYIKNNSGKKIELSYGKVITLFTVDQFEDFVKKQYSKSRTKMKKLLMEDIPEDFIQRQLNDSRYISKVVKNLLSNIVREEAEPEAISKNVIATGGAITSTLKQDWGLNDVWNDIITPRFQRLNELTKTKNFGDINEATGKFLSQVPLELQKGFNKKRIDHRHHALDAIVIACASRSHVNFLNNESALAKGKNRQEKEGLRYDLRRKLCEKKWNDDSKQHYKWVFNKPWDSFTQETKAALQEIIVSFKQNLRVINKTSNQYQAWKHDEQGMNKKVLEKQANTNWAIRKPMHKDTVAGLVRLKFRKVVSLSAALAEPEMIVEKTLRDRVKELAEQGYDKKKLLAYFKEKNNQWQEADISRVEVFYWDETNVASRVKLDESFTAAKIKTITDEGIQTILLNHLKKYEEIKSGKSIEHPELAFSPDGIDLMNHNLASLNNGKSHQPIFKVRTFEPLGNKFAVGQTGNKIKKFVEAAKGTNLFFAVYADEKGKRSFETIPLNIVVERQKQGLSSVPEKSDAGHTLRFHLSPNDLVYVGTEKLDYGQLKAKHIYKIVSFTGNRLYAVPYYVATAIVDKVEFTQLNKLETSIDKLSIKEHCLKINFNRLGHVRHSSKLQSSNELVENMLSEPSFEYSKQIQTFSSFEEMNEGDAKANAAIAPETHLKNASERALRIFPDNQQPMNKKINFKDGHTD